jgi:polar amino acid transport system substrate-binding protein
MIDVFAALTGSRPVRVYATSITSPNAEVVDEDSASVAVTYEDGSIGTLVYLANGDDSVPKEYCEVSAGGKTAVMRNFEEVSFHEGRSQRRKKYKGGKGHAQEVEHFIEVLRGNATPAFTVASLVDTTAVTLAALESMRTHAAVEL